MDLSLLKRRSEFEWAIEPHGKMRVPGVLFASEELVRAMDHKVYEQVTNVATLPGIRTASMAMPDAHWGYGFAVGGVAAFDPDEGVVSAGGVGFDISCGVRCLRTRLHREDVAPRKKELADALFRAIPAGVGSTGRIRLGAEEMTRMLNGGARWAVEKGYGERADLERVEEGGQMKDARVEAVSDRAKARMRDEVGTLGSGNHYLEVQEVAEVHDAGRGGGLRRARGRRGGVDPLRLARPRPPDRHRGAARDARRAAAATASSCPTASWPARRCARRRASATSARCARPSTSPSPTGRCSLISRARRSRPCCPRRT